MKTLLSAILFAAMISTASAAGKDTRCYELRTYYAAPGKLDELHARFRNHTLKIFEKHGMVNVGYWVPLENPDSKLIYILAHASRDAAKKSWSGFGGDPDWKKAQKESEANGRLVSKAESKFLEATDYSPAIDPGAGAEPRAFELRIYKCEPGRLPNLNARFRDHTVKLFAKHGMTNIGYWTPMDQAQGGDDTLIYLLAHKSKEAAAESFKAFRDDPDWVAARKASEEKAGGSLTAKDGVQSIFMKATDYSAMK